MDDVFDLIFSIWNFFINTLATFQFDLFGHQISFLGFFVGIIIMSLLFKVLLILPSPNSTSSFGSSVSERIKWLSSDDEDS